MSTSPRPFQQNRIKYGNSTNLFKRPRNMAKNPISKRADLIRKIRTWTTFYRRNYHRFAEHYLGLKELKLFQKIMLYLMGISENMIVVASRGISKSFTIGLFACIHSILYPRSLIVIVASTKDQAGLIIKEKIQGELMRWSPNLSREIEKVTSSQNNYEISFHNGSRIKVVTAGESSRGQRAHVIIYEEFRLISKQIVDEIIDPFLISRQAPYMNNPKYKTQYGKSLKEEPRRYFISSAYYKSYNEFYMWDEIKRMTKNLFREVEETPSTFILSFDYLLSIYEGLKTRKVMDEARKKSDEISFMMEYENIMFNENADAYFKLDMFKKNQSIKKCFYPMLNEDYVKLSINGKKNVKNPNQIKRQDGEIRIVSGDFAARKGITNDNTILSCIRAIPTKEGYTSEIMYIESHNGENTDRQALRIKQLYSDFEADYIVMDTHNIGISIYQALGKVTSDEERGIEYEPYGIIGNLKYYMGYSDSKIEEFRDFTVGKNPLPIIIPFQVDAELNSDIAVTFRDKLVRHLVKMPVSFEDAFDYLLDKNEEFKREQVSETPNYKKFNLYKMPYIETSNFINECINLEYTVVSGKIKIDEKRGRKDRYTSVSYGVYFISLLERDLLREDNDLDFDISNFIFFG
jgi:hypothetical protein